LSKLNLPLTLTGERIEFQRLYDLTGTAGRNMTTSGIYTFTSLSSGNTFSTATGGEYNVFLQLKTVLDLYNINEIDFNSIVDSITTQTNNLTTHTATNSSDIVKGHVELATLTETITGTDNTRAVTPIGLKSATDLLIPLSQKGEASGVSTLGTDVKIPIAQIPTLGLVNMQHVVGDILIYASGAEIYQNSTTLYTPWSAIIPKVGMAGSVRVSFTLKSSSASYTASARITKNGVAVGTLRSTVSTTGVVFTEDITGLSVGDVLSLEGIMSSASGLTTVVDYKISVGATPQIT